MMTLLFILTCLQTLSFGKGQHGCNYFDLSVKNQDKGFPGGTVVENLPANAGTRVRALVWEDPTCHGATGPVSHNY